MTAAGFLSLALHPRALPGPVLVYTARIMELSFPLGKSHLQLLSTVMKSLRFLEEILKTRYVIVKQTTRE